MRIDQNRREFLTLGVGIFVALTAPFATRRPARLVRRTVPLMGTIAELQAAHPDLRTAEDAIDSALAELFWVERTMSRFLPDSDLGRANRFAARDAVAVTPETALVLAAAMRWAEASEGRFDPAAGAASELWDVLHRTVPPPEPATRRLARRGFWRKLTLDRYRGAPVVRFTDPDTRLDLGAIAKGYGIDRAVSALRGCGIGSAIVTVGGDLFALGRAPTGEPWRVGIRSPHDRSKLAGTLEVTNRAVATSGDYERFFEWKGTRYHHLMDPDTGAPRRTSFHSSTVVADTCMEADPASTTAFGLAREPATRLVQRLCPGAEVIPLL